RLKPNQRIAVASPFAVERLPLRDGARGNGEMCHVWWRRDASSGVGKPLAKRLLIRRDGCVTRHLSPVVDAEQLELPLGLKDSPRCRLQTLAEHADCLKHDNLRHYEVDLIVSGRGQEE